MPPIDGLGRIVQILQNKVSERKGESVRSTSKKNAHINKDKQAFLSLSQTPIDELEKQLIYRLKRIPDEQANSSTLARYFVESILTWEFGEELLQDPSFTDLSRDVVTTFKSNEVVWQKVEKLLFRLREK